MKELFDQRWPVQVIWFCESYHCMRTNSMNGGSEETANSVDSEPNEP